MHGRCRRDERERRLRSIRVLPTPTAGSHTTMSAVRADVEETRSRGYGIDNGENIEGISCFSVAIPGRMEPPTAVHPRGD